MPSVPPPSGVSCTTKYAICANASVTMMKYTPLVRSDSAPTNSAYSAAASTAAGNSQASEAGSFCGDSSTAA